jgi:hypothetical protein
LAADGKWSVALHDIFGGSRGTHRSVRELFNNTFEAADVLNITEEIDHLAATYVAQGVVTPKYEDDARHVAACTVNRIDFLVSWNFRHMVNVQRESAFNGVNLLNGYPAIRIVNPLEIIYGNQDQNL